MERSWDTYYKYFKEFEFNLFEIFIFLEYQQKIIDLGYIGQSQINQNVLNPGQFCVVDAVHSQGQMQPQLGQVSFSL